MTRKNIFYYPTLLGAMFGLPVFAAIEKRCFKNIPCCWSLCLSFINLFKVVSYSITVFYMKNCLKSVAVFGTYVVLSVSGILLFVAVTFKRNNLFYAIKLSHTFAYVNIRSPSSPVHIAIQGAISTLNIMVSIVCTAIFTHYLPPLDFYIMGHEVGNSRSILFLLSANTVVSNSCMMATTVVLILLFSCFCHVLRVELRTLNRELQGSSKDLTDQQKTFKRHSKDLSNIFSIHIRHFRKIKKLVFEVENAMSWCILLLYALSIGWFFNAFGLSLRINNFGSNINTLFFLMNVSCFCFIVLFSVTLNASSVTKEYEALKIALIYLSEKLSSYSTCNVKLVTSFKFLYDTIKDNRLYFTAAGMFEIQDDILLKVFGIILTYIFIVHQYI